MTGNVGGHDEGDGAVEAPYSQIAGWVFAPLIALQFLTRIPIGRLPNGAFRSDKGRSFLFHPIVGLVVGGCAAGALVFLHRLGLAPAACAVLTVVVTAVLTGGMHEDGLADTADALGPLALGDRLRVMRDSRIGTFGSIALWTLLSLKTIALSGLVGGRVLPSLLAAHVLARWSSLPLAAMLPDARAALIPETPAGLGGGMVSMIRPVTALGASALVVAALWPILDTAHLLYVGVASVALVMLTGAFYKSRFGGITGDCLGATNQIVEITVLLMLGHLTQT